MASSSVPKLYVSVIEDVVCAVREAFMDEGVDEQALQELKQVWEKKLHESRAMREETELQRLPPPPLAPLPPTQPQHQGVHQQLAIPLLQYTAGTAADLQKGGQKLTLTMPAHMAQAGLQTIVAPPGVQLPPEFASLFQGGVTLAHGQPQQLYQALTQEQLKQQPTSFTLQVQPQQVPRQVDGAGDTSEEDDDEDDFPDPDDDPEDDPGEDDDEEEEPLNSDDDVSEDDDPGDLFDTENVVVCQYDKITRSKNRWKFHLKDGIMNLAGRDFVFQKALGDSEW